MTTRLVMQTDIPGAPAPKRGKVRDIYDLGEHLLIVATDRISAYDVVMRQAIPDKGRVLTQLSLFWFGLLQDVVENHLITADVAQFPAALQPFAAQLEGRSMLVKRAEVVPVECVARGYLSGSGWREYRESQTVCGIALPPGLRESEMLPAPIFTPATKATSGHDINITATQAIEMVGRQAFDFLQSRTITVYQKAADYARSRGIIIADTKFEFGHYQDRLIVVDEVLTPDSSRFWPAEGYQPGRSQASFDKQPVRDYLDNLGWDHTPPPPNLTPEVVAGTTARYREAYRLLTGRELD